MIPWERYKKGLRLIGVRGGLKTMYHSIRHTSSWFSLIFHPNVITDISIETSFDIRNALICGIRKPGASHPKLMCSKFSTTPNASIVQSGNGKASIGPASVVHVEGEFSIGNSYINSHSRIMCSDHISIGDDCAIAWNVEINDGDRHTLVIEGEESPTTAPIIIRDHVWIGHNVSIKKGVTVGDEAVIASNSVITHDVPSNTLVAGTPAEVIQENVTWKP